ncbi:bactofilin family protein [Flavicella sediminum]|uniref:bactofilin family protein n=1 Tax=Flavicella sediminum TaxID=2585141 RepID=UPI0011212F7A|nr:polymer-forming cytoskeletal protein [Flavicella sediminum]
MKDNVIYERNVIGKKTSITGDIVSEGDFRIDGVVEGSVKAKGKVIVGKEGRVQGEIECSNAEIEGEVNGSLSVNNMLSLKATAVVSGEVVIGKLTVEPGAAFNAICSMKGMLKEMKNGSQTSREKTA